MANAVRVRDVGCNGEHVAAAFPQIIRSTVKRILPASYKAHAGLVFDKPLGNRAAQTS